MAGHSHSANIKWRKDRQDSARSQIFIKLRKKLENILREEGKVSEKSLNLARENKFPKERVYKIWEKISQEIYSVRQSPTGLCPVKQKGSVSNSHFLYQAQFGIVVYLEEVNEAVQEAVNQLNLKKLPPALLPNYFQSVYSLKIEFQEKDNNLEEYLLAALPLEIWEKMNYDKAKQVLFSSDRETIAEVKNTLQNNSRITLEEKKYWKSFLPQALSAPEEKNYYSQLQKKLKNIPFYTNIEE